MKKRFLIWLMQTRLYSWMLYKIIPFVRFSMYYTDFRGVEYHAAYENLKQGDVILGVDRRKLTSFLIPGVMSHAAFCVGKRADGYYTEVCEMTHHDFTQSMFFDICKEADRVVIMRCLDFTPEHVEAMVNACWDLKGAKYDTQFTLGVDALYCSELVYQCDRYADLKVGGKKEIGADYGRMQVSLADLAGLGRQYISPDGLMFGKNMICVHDSAAEFTGLLGPVIKAMCAKNKDAAR